MNELEYKSSRFESWLWIIAITLLMAGCNTCTYIFRKYDVEALKTENCQHKSIEIKTKLR